MEKGSTRSRRRIAPFVIVALPLGLLVLIQGILFLKVTSNINKRSPQQFPLKFRGTSDPNPQQKPPESPPLRVLNALVERHNSSNAQGTQPEERIKNEDFDHILQLSRSLHSCPSLLPPNWTNKNKNACRDLPKLGGKDTTNSTTLIIQLASEDVSTDKSKLRNLFLLIYGILKKFSPVLSTTDISEVILLGLSVSALQQGDISLYATRLIQWHQDESVQLRIIPNLTTLRNVHVSSGEIALINGANIVRNGVLGFQAFSKHLSEAMESWSRTESKNQNIFLFPALNSSSCTSFDLDDFTVSMVLKTRYLCLLLSPFASTATFPQMLFHAQSLEKSLLKLE